jgi:hypothetical protein
MVGKGENSCLLSTSPYLVSSKSFWKQTRKEESQRSSFVPNSVVPFSNMMFISASFSADKVIRRE